VLDPKFWIEKVGFFGVLAIVFAESGLLIGFFLPGDSLLFTAGFIASNPDLTKLGLPEDLSFPLIPLLIGVAAAAIIGDQVGYLFGRRVGPSLFRRPNSRLFKQENIDKAQAFFDRYGPKTIVLARFVPIVRTFAPVVAGVSRMRYRTFVAYNVIGGVAWGVGITLLGYFLGQVQFFEDHLELAVLAIVAISILPMAIEILRARRHAKGATDEVDSIGELVGDIADDNPQR
jgi:membrane-associated protein